MNVKCLVSRLNLKDDISLTYLIYIEYLQNIIHSNNSMSVENLQSSIYLKYFRKHPIILINRLINLKKCHQHDLSNQSNQANQSDQLNESR